MKRWKRVALTTSAVVVVAAVGLAARTMMMAGVFDTAAPLALKCGTLKGVTGAEDIAIDRNYGIVFLSATDRRASGRASAQDGIYVLNADLFMRVHDGSSVRGVTPGTIAKLAGTPADFHPHGISLLYADAHSDRTLMAVNHRSDGTSSIVVFHVDLGVGGVTGIVDIGLTEIGDIESDKLSHPNDVVAVDKERFYVTNDHGSKTVLGMQLENYLMLPRANVLYYDGSTFREAATGLVFANGIAVSNDGRHLYVAESTGRHIQSFARDPFSGQLGEKTTFDFPSGPDNIDVDADGALWVAGHPKMFALVGYSSDPSKPSPTEIFKVATKDGIPQSAVPVYANTGAELGAGSVGAVAGKSLFIGSIFDPKILECRLP